MRTSKIIGVRKIGKIKTLDITVDHEGHVFYGNGIATSNSHGIGYSICSYYSAYCKAHYPLEFYRTWLSHAEHKIKPFIEIYYLVNSAKLDGIPIYPPSITYKEKDFFIKNNGVYYGLRSIKGVGDRELEKLFSICDEISTDTEKIQWNQLLYRLDEVNKRSVTALIESGAFDFMKVSRTRMMHEFSRIKELTKTEIAFVKDNLTGLPLEECLTKLLPLKKEGGGVSSEKRQLKVKNILSALQNPGRSLEDSPAYISSREEHLMGVSLCQSYLDECADSCSADTTCKEIVDGKNGKMLISVEIKEVKEHTIKKKGDNYGRTMAFIIVADATCELDSVISFPDSYESYGELITEGNFVMLLGDKEKDSDSFIIKKVYQL